MKNPSDVPYIEDALMAWLERTTLSSPITPTSTIQAIMFDAGQQAVLQRIRAVHAKQRDNLIPS
ncbi:hypothetical protein UFOVP823_38 [uncultured Caudovirales phage]|uniref:Uncharacterized protein n=1 Tax=uncultured Caudovirales phage TaxID=2100421 RepID=A0A6J5PCV9_9CAUD|nr:hypothetical protein UFOVP823_38 [uncultured Caudovirales phage]